MASTTFAFVGGNAGPWRVSGLKTVTGEPLPRVERLEIHAGSAAAPPFGWVLRGATSYERYVTRAEKTRLLVHPPVLGRPEATRAALIPITKSDAWWALPQDERQAIVLASRHIEIGLKYVRAVARRLHHGRDLGEPFDFLTWFEYAPTEASAFEDLVAALRATEEWKYVVREIDVRLERE